MNAQNKVRIFAAIACLLSTALCVGYASARADMPEWLRSHGGGIPYIMFWIFLIASLLPDKKQFLRICLVVVLATVGLEVLQLWNPDPLEAFRNTKFGAALLGSTFAWQDIPPYLIGGALGYLALVGIDRAAYRTP